ncbi:MAG TPA: sugar-binding protein [Candidatus Binatia bacterium]|jgi:ribose transport system substrate-binding protein|nr:sugar-binding protein [Candidatus Binatia bacterium]
MKPHLALALGSLALVAALSGCGQKETTPSPEGAPSSGAAAQKKLKLAFVSNNAANFWTIARRGCEEAEKQLGNVTVLFRIPSTGSAAEQQQILDDLLAAGVDGIAVSPVDPANETEALNKIAAQALLITQDSDAPNSKRVCYLGTDNIAAGVEAGKLIKEVLPNGGKIMVFVGKMDAQNAKERFAGIKQELQGSKVEIIDVRTDDTDTVRAQKNAEDTLVKYPDVACLVGLWNYNGPAILNAVRDGGKLGQVKIVCFDEEAETLNGVAQGQIYGTVVQQPFEFGKQTIQRMAAYLRGDKQALAGGKQIIPTMEIKKENVADFQVRLKQLLAK